MGKYDIVRHQSAVRIKPCLEILQQVEELDGLGRLHRDRRHAVCEGQRFLTLTRAALTLQITVLQAASEKMATAQEILRDWPDLRDSLPHVLAEARFAALCTALTAQKGLLAWGDLETVAKFSIEVHFAAISV